MYKILFSNFMVQLLFTIWIYSVRNPVDLINKIIIEMARIIHNYCGKVDWQKRDNLGPDWPSGLLSHRTVGHLPNFGLRFVSISLSNKLPITKLGSLQRT